MWSFGDDRIAVRFPYEWRDASGGYRRSCGNELREFDAAGLMRPTEPVAVRPYRGDAYLVHR
ncbi:DUF1348 family protein [Streptomyces sp. NPDC059071]|uniref:DUF1348 family protein n=1 Tax=unclassified Streptomyces TaxID=2593676 RepID=UPI003648C5D9